MFYDRALNHRINHIHEKELHIAYKDYENDFGFLLSLAENTNDRNDFGFLLEQSMSVPIHVRNLQWLMTEIYKKSAV